MRQIYANKNKQQTKYTLKTRKCGIFTSAVKIVGGSAHVKQGGSRGDARKYFPFILDSKLL